MAEIILDVNFKGDEALKKLQEVQSQITYLRNENTALKKAMKDVDTLTAEGAETFAKMSTQISQNNAQIKALTTSEKVLQQQGQNLDAVQSGLGDSFAEQAKLLSVLKQQYSNMTAEERKSAEGKELLKKLQELDKQVKANDASMGVFNRNVGNYPKTFASAFAEIGDAFKSGASGADSFGGAVKGAFKGGVTAIKDMAKAFVTNPIGLLITGIVVVAKKLADAFKKNDDAGTALQKLFSSFDPILKMINKGFEKVATAIGFVANKIADLLGKFSDEVKAAQEITLATDKLEDTEREYAKNHAQRQLDIAKLRDEAAQKDKFTAKEREERLMQAIELEKQDLEDKKNIQAEKLRLLEEEAKRTADTSDEMKTKINEARIAMTNSETEYYTETRRLQSQLSTFRTEIANEEKAQSEAVIKAREEEQKARAEQDAKTQEEERKRAEEHKRAMADMRRELEEARITQIQDDTERELAELKLKYDRELEALMEKYEQEGTLTEEEENLYNELKLIREQEYLTAKQAIIDTAKQEEERKLAEANKREEENVKKTQEAIRNNYKATAMSMGSLFGNLSDLLGEFSEDNKKAGQASKAFALASIAIDEAMNIANTAKAITSAIAGATEAGAATGPAAPITTPIFIAEMVAAVMAGLAGTVASIKQATSIVNSQKFAEGGIVSGSSWSGDKIVARLNSGEMVLNKRQQANLFNAVNVGNVGVNNFDALQQAMTNALEAMPSPTMVYSEFKTFQRQQADIEEFSTLN